MSTDAGRLFGRSIAFPPRLGPDGRWAFSEGEDNIREAIRIILKTELKERLFLPDFGGGLSQMIAEPNTVTTRAEIQHRIQKSLKAWEPRISLESVTVDASPDDPQSAVATITYRLVATQARERVDLTVTLSG
jgi:Bacteriophage baseplate protein W